jgi:NADPH-dependent 2,4-dienoyl-CoA reductase/sulfur reductase-like enzyme/rhodanese-related sulfurtransferase
MARRTIVIIGGALGGPAAALRAREADEDARIVLLERSEHVGYASSGLPYAVSGEAVSPEAIDREDAESLWDLHRVEVRVGVSAEAVDASAQRVRLGGGETLDYSALVYAAGATAVPPDVPGLAGAANVTAFRTLEDLERVSHAAGDARIAVLGAGAAAVEAADAFRRGGRAVVLATGGPRLLPTFSDEPAELAARALGRAGVEVRRARVTSAERAGDRVSRLVLGDGAPADVDVVVLAGDLRPQTELLRRAGAQLHDDGSLRIDDGCATTLPHVYACGQCVSVPHAVTGWPVWPPQVSAAERTAQVAGTVAAGGKARLAPMVDAVIVRAGELAVGRTGLTGEEAAVFAADEAGTTVVHGSSCDRFLAAARPLSVALFYHHADGLLLGGEAWGAAGVDKRVDVLSMAILGRFSVDRLAAADFAYAPPFSTARDVVGAATADAAAARSGHVRSWTAAELAAAAPSVTVVDVEPERALPSDALAARPLPLAELRQRLDELPRGGPLVFVSETGRRAYLAARIARQRGRRDAGYLAGGRLSWRAAGARSRATTPAR